MDFELIEHHPWYTGGAILVGGFLLYLVFRRSGSGSSAGTTQYVSAGGGTDANAAALAAQQSQVNAYTQGLQLQGATQVSLAQIGADVSKYTTGATADTINRQTDAQLALGLGTQSAVVQQTAIQATIQSKYIDAIIAAFTGHSSPSTTPLPISTYNPQNPTNPTNQITGVTPVYFDTPGGTGGTNSPITVGGVNPGSIAPGNAPLDSGTKFGTPNYASCDPRDVACVGRNQSMGINWVNSLLGGQSTNNRNQCLANAALSAGQPNYAALIAACG